METMPVRNRFAALRARPMSRDQDRKSTRLNSSHANISYAVFCLKKNRQDVLAHGQRTVALDARRAPRDGLLQAFDPDRNEGGAPEQNRILAPSERLGDLAAGHAP